ncbi:MAG: YggS family pyridoxal phosphate-dependent enzyme [Acidobacteriota bacterium]
MEIRDSLNRINERVEKAASACGRNPEDIKVVAVSKRFPVGKIIEANDAGQVFFGENMVQEAREKAGNLTDKNIELHLIGHLQSNKARAAVQIFDCIQTVDRARIALKLNSLAEEFERELAVLLQVNVGREIQKAGVDPDSAGELVSIIDECRFLRLKGLMTIPPFSDDPEVSRKYFRKLRELRDALNGQRKEPLTELSMGMSHDFEVAIQEGSTIIRVGAAIFGPRPPQINTPA